MWETRMTASWRSRSFHSRIISCFPRFFSSFCSAYSSLHEEEGRNQHGGHRTHSCFGFIAELPERCIGVLLQKMHPAIAIILTAHQQYQNRVTIFRQTWIYARKTSPTRKQTGHFGSAPSNTLRHQCRLCWVEILPRVKSSKQDPTVASLYTNSKLFFKAAYTERIFLPFSEYSSIPFLQMNPHDKNRQLGIFKRLSRTV